MQIDILMATYNGEKYISKQIDSILCQTYQDWKLIIRDDCSTDATRAILLQYAKEYPDKIYVVDDSKGNIGVVRNFKELMKYSQNKYAMFCDQDDIWKATKIADSISEMQQIGIADEKTPAMVFSDLTVVDSDENVISDSFLSRNHLEVKKIELEQLIFWNVVVGNTILINQPLKELMLDMPDDAGMHDHWAVLACIANNGIVRFLNKQTVLYRQHSENVVGDKYETIFNKLKKIFSLSGWSWRIKNAVYCYQRLEQQAVFLYEKYSHIMTKEHSEALYKLITIWEHNVFRRIYIICSRGFLPNDLYLRIGMLMYFISWGQKRNGNLY